VLRHPDYTRNRIRDLTKLILDKIYTERRPVERLRVSGRTDRISYAEAQKLTYKPVTIGTQFGPLWATYWFKAEATIPKEWAGQRVDLLWVSHSEATLWIDGRTIQGLNFNHGDRPDAILARRAKAGQKLVFDIEMACNRKFGEAFEAGERYKSIQPFILDQCDIALFDPLAWEIAWDIYVLGGLEKEIATEGGAIEKSWGGELLYELNRFANAFDLSDRTTWATAHRILKPLLKHKNADRTFELSAIGHAHIDTAWLWPLAETWRKCERTFSSQTAYMDDYPEFKFSCSQAYQYDIIKARNPDLYKRIRAKVKAGQFIPVGGTWIEPDCNIPSGEALCRQFLTGQKFFEKEFGFRCKEFWNPDVFGYNGQLPQIMHLAGINRFLTQKLSWNAFNKPHHHTFTWQGIDGSEVLAHFPPGDTYNAEVSIAELRKNARDYKDHDRSRNGYMLFGWGDGGGGPTKKMLETIRRAKDLQGLPRTEMRTSDDFFTRLENDITDRPLLIGELYFEYHRGTYTTQAATKRGNRKNEWLLHDVEFLSTVAAASDIKYPHQEIDRLWKILLLNQFHDILPGSSITLVYEDARRHHAEIEQSATALRAKAASALTKINNQASTTTPINTLGFARREVVESNDQLLFIDAPSYGIGEVVDPHDRVTLNSTRTGWTLENGHLRAEISKAGALTSLVEKGTGRESLAAPGNILRLYEDMPTAWDAWDVDPFHLETGKDCPPAESAKIARQDPLRAEITFSRKIGKRSTATQTIRLDAEAYRIEFHTEVDWQEERKFLKVAFPLNVRSMHATYEMQFGCVERPTHYNTPYDLARYEVPGHKWADLSEHGFGVALLSESKYGWSTFGNTMYLSLLRATKYPDPQADLGRHQFAYALMPHAGNWRDAGVVAEAHRFNVPPLLVKGRADRRSFASVDASNLVLDTIKRAEDGDGIVLRLYECHGARGTAKLRVELPFKTVNRCNILEDDEEVIQGNEHQIPLTYKPFEVISLKLR
jgi:alpha-mannosidase